MNLKRHVELKHPISLRKNLRVNDDHKKLLTKGNRKRTAASFSTQVSGKRQTCPLDFQKPLFIRLGTSLQSSGLRSEMNDNYFLFWDCKLSLKYKIVNNKRELAHRHAFIHRQHVPGLLTALLWVFVWLLLLMGWWHLAW